MGIVAAVDASSTGMDVDIPPLEYETAEIAPTSTASASSSIRTTPANTAATMMAAIAIVYAGFTMILPHASYPKRGS